MKVAVSNPPWPGRGFGARTNVRWPHRRGDKKLAYPIYLAYTLSLLKKSGYEARGFDAVWEGMDTEAFTARMKAFSPAVIVMEVSTPSIGHDTMTADALKLSLPDAFIVFCGPHATYFHKELIRENASIDACIRGEFEMAVKEICDCIKNGKRPASVKGVTYRDSAGSVVSNPERPLLEDLDTLPYPDREDFPIARYQQAFYCGKKTALMVSSRGCPHQCTYCLWPSTLTSRRYRSRSPLKVVDELEFLIREEGIDEVFFDDDEFILDRAKVDSFCRELIRRRIRIKWHCMGRVNVVTRETLALMKEAGCYQIFYGFESGSEKILRSVRKGITRAQTRNAVRMTRKAGIVAGGSFIIGTPEESWETFGETMRFARSLGANWVQFALCAPFPGTPMYDEAKTLGLLEARTWEDFDGTHGPVMRTRHLSREELSGALRKAYVSYYTAPGVIYQNVMSIRSARQLRRVLRGAMSVLSRVFYYSE